MSVLQAKEPGETKSATRGESPELLAGYLLDATDRNTLWVDYGRKWDRVGFHGLLREAIERYMSVGNLRH